jgi:hypothetical protein
MVVSSGPDPMAFVFFNYLSESNREEITCTGKHLINFDPGLTKRVKIRAHAIPVANPSMTIKVSSFI